MGDTEAMRQALERILYESSGLAEALAFARAALASTDDPDCVDDGLPENQRRSPDDALRWIVEICDNLDLSGESALVEIRALATSALTTAALASTEAPERDDGFCVACGAHVDDDRAHIYPWTAPDGTKACCPAHWIKKNWPPSAAPAPEGVPEDHRVCSHGIYHHGCPSCDRQDPEDR